VSFSHLAHRDLVLNSSKHLKGQRSLSVMTDLPPELSKMRGDLLKRRFEMPPEERKFYRVKQLKEAPFLELFRVRG
jgi:hypothetical protein